MAHLDRLKDLPVSRRQLVTGAAVGGGVLVAWWLYPRSYDTPLKPREDEVGFGGWLTIGNDGVVTVAVPQLEMGQGVTTLLAQVVATELGADWRQMGVEPVPPGGIYANLPLAAKWSPMWSRFPSFASDADDLLVERFARENAFSVTADGTSLDAYEQPCREAAAVARAMLSMAAAERWDVAWEECRAEGGFIIEGERRLSFGELAQEASQFDPPSPPPLRPELASETVLEGEGSAPTAFPRLDLPSKVDGSFQFAADVRLPGMVYASVRHGPVGHHELVSFEEARAARVRGLVGVVKSKRWLAAVAQSWWGADQALFAMRPRFSGPGPVDSVTIDEILEDSVSRGEAERVFTIGEPDDDERPADVVRRYDIEAHVHAPVETASATARFEGGRLELWIATQAPEATRAAAARAVGLGLRDVVIYPMAAGGSFDARLEKQHAIEVAQIAEQIGRPVQLTWSRAQELQSVPPRTPVAAILAANLSSGEERAPQVWRSTLALPATVREFGHRLFDNLTAEAAIGRAAGEADALACEGAVPTYGVAHVAVDHIPTELPIPTGRMRGNAAAYTAFFNECFIDELAEEAGRDAFLYRMALLGQAPRMANCLRRATRLGDWNGGRQGSGEGLAMVRMGSDENGGHIACVANASRGEGGVRVSRLVAAVDIGRVVNLDLARQQIEGGLIFGLSLALGSSIRFVRGHPSPNRLAGLSLPQLADTPDITVDFIDSDAPPFDPGELGVAVAPPAIANALFTATGLRTRRLPLFSEGT